MSLRKPSVVRVAMAKRVASKWLGERATPEYRVTVFGSSADPKNLPSLLRAFRDRKTRIAGLDPIPDLGMRVKGERVTLWSRNREGMIRLNSWLTSNGCETTGIW